MLRFAVAVIIILIGLGLQLAMVSGAIEPTIVRALGGYALLFVGMALILVAVARAFRGR